MGNPRPELSAPPATLYHGTPAENLLTIFMTQQLRPMACDEGPAGISLTGDIEIAKRFASSDCRDGDFLHTEILGIEQPDMLGAVLEFDRASLGELVPYCITGRRCEDEWRSLTPIPFTAVRRIYVPVEEIILYRDLLLANRNFEPQPWEGVDPEYFEKTHLPWARAYLRDDFYPAAAELLSVDSRVTQFADAA